MATDINESNDYVCNKFVQEQLKSAENKYTNNQCIAKGKKTLVGMHLCVWVTYVYMYM